jgi:hypothetical protein
MQRREFLKTLSAAGTGLLLSSSSLSVSAQQASLPPDPDVKRVLIMFKCHFDAGFIDTQAAVVHKYFSNYFPHAIQIAADQRAQGGHRYVWTTGSWLLYEYLEQASPEDRKRMDEAVGHGDIAWHALPFTWQTELIDPSMITGALAISTALDRRYGRTTTGAKMTDVPGHTRGIIAPLAAHGVRFLDIGVNDASTPAVLPPIFLWKDTSGAALPIMYHGGYGGVARVSGSDLAIAIEVRDDNSGPHTPEEIGKIYANLAARFPNAEISAASLSDIANAADPYRNALPVVTQEIGDTWIHGIASDPLKVARYRALARLCNSWIAQGKFRVADATDLALLRHVLLEAEHTWGTDTKTWLDFDHYKPADLAAMQDTRNYKVVEFSWTEKRQDLLDGIATLPTPLREEASRAISGLTPVEPQPPAQAKRRSGDATIETTHFTLALDPHTGAIVSLRNKATGRDWAGQSNPLALFVYQTLSQQDYDRFIANYIISKADWAFKDFGKPNIGKLNAESREWIPTLTDLYVEQNAEGHKVLAVLQIQDAEAFQSGIASFPQKIYCELSLPEKESVIYLNLSWFGKPATRMPEAIWLTFNPIARQNQGWKMDKSGEQVSPFDVVTSGNRHMHALSTGIRYQEDTAIFSVETIDAPLVALGDRTPLGFSNEQPDLAKGVHSCLFNNAWGTNYIMWFGEDMHFRFVLRPS